MSRQEVIRQIVERNERQLDLNEEPVARDDPMLFTLACDTFGTWETALRYAGFSAKIVARKRMCPPDVIVRTLQRMCKDGEKLTASHIRVRQWRFYRAAIQYFGNWHQALRAAGVDPKNVRTYPPHQRPSRQHIIEGITTRQAQGLSLRWMDVSRDNRAFAVCAKHMFGSWDKALRVAGFTKKGAILASNEMPAAEPAGATQDLGTADGTDRSTESETPPRSRNGRWNKSVVISELQALHRSGQLVNSASVDRGLVRAATRYFGRWHTALSAAGIDLPGVRRPARRDTT
jgi:hypothetical protein